MLYLNGRDDHNSSRPRDTALSAPAARGHNVDLIGIVCIEIGHDVAWINSVQVQIIVVVIIVVDVVVNVDN